MSSFCLSLTLAMMTITVKNSNLASNDNISIFKDEKKELSQTATSSDNTDYPLYDERSDGICGINYGLQSYTNQDELECKDDKDKPYCHNKEDFVDILDISYRQNKCSNSKQDDVATPDVITGDELFVQDKQKRYTQSCDAVSHIIQYPVCRDDSEQIKYIDQSVTNVTMLMETRCKETKIETNCTHHPKTNPANNNSILLNDHAMFLINETIQKNLISYNRSHQAQILSLYDKIQQKDIVHDKEIRDINNINDQIKNMNNTWTRKIQKMGRACNKQIKKIDSMWQTKYAALTDTIQKQNLEQNKQIADIYTFLTNINELQKQDTAHSKQMKDLNNIWDTKHALLVQAMKQQEMEHTKHIQAINNTWQTKYASLTDYIGKQDAEHNKTISDMNNEWKAQYMSFNNSMILLNDTLQTYMMSCVERTNNIDNDWHNRYGSANISMINTQLYDNITILNNDIEQIKRQRDICNHTVHSLNNNISSLNEVNDRRRSEYISLNQSYSEMVAKNYNLTIINKELIHDITLLNKRIQLLQDEVNSSQTQYTVLKNKRINQQLNSDKLNNQITQITEQNKKCHNNVDSLTGHITLLTQTIETNRISLIRDINDTWLTKLGDCNIKLSKEEKRLTQKQNEWYGLYCLVSDSVKKNWYIPKTK